MRSKKIEAPVIVIGLGRSGSTLFHRMLATEKSLQWFCQILDKKLAWLGTNKFLMSLRANPVVGEAIRKRLEPVEAYAFWDRVFPGFRNPCRDLAATDVNDRIAAHVYAALEQTVNLDSGRLLLKITGWPRIACLKTLFPDACLIHVSRDPRAVANSLLQVSWWRGWQGPSSWRWGPLSEADNEIWMRHDQSFVALAAIQCRIYQRAYKQSVASLPNGSILEIRYDELCTKPKEQLSRVFSHANLVWSPEFEQSLNTMSLRNTDYKFGEQLSSQQVKILESVLEEVAYEYE